MNTRSLIIALVAIFAVCVGASTAHAQCGCSGLGKVRKGGKPAGPKCPVTGRPVDFSVKVAAKDGPVYFCSERCIQKYQAKPKKFARRVAAQRKAAAVLPKMQVTCPVTGKPVDQEISIEQGGLEVYFCCKGCIPRFEKDPAKYAAGLANGYTYQAKCPVRGGDIDPQVFVVGLSDGSKVFFCCAGCDKRFLKDPAKYARSLAAQGIRIGPDKIKGGEKGEDGKHEGHDSHGDGGHDD